MATWLQDDVGGIEQSDDLHISPYRADGVTPGTPRWIWSVVVNGALYVRAYNGTASRWHQAALSQRAGRIRVAGGDWEVTFEPVDGPVQEAIDAAYRAKYADAPTSRR